MAYEIPQKLQYEEKIIFGLTFRQLVYALIFLVPSLVIFLKTSFNIFIKLAICAVLISLGVMFMFFNLSRLIKNFLAWKKFRLALLMDEKMKEFLGIKNIENGILYIKQK
jgi:hypothetical protein